MALFHPKCTPFPIQLLLVRLDQGVSPHLGKVLRSQKLGNLFIFDVVCSKKFRVVCHDLIWVPVNILRCFVRSFLVVKHPNCNPFCHNFGVCGSHLVLISSFREDHQGFREVIRVILFRRFRKLQTLLNAHGVVERNVGLASAYKKFPRGRGVKVHPGPGAERSLKRGLQPCFWSAQGFRRYCFD